MDTWIARLPESEGRIIIKQLLMGNAQQAERQLKSRFLAWQREQCSGIDINPARRTVAALWELTKTAAETRSRQQAEQRKQAEAERQAARASYLRTLADDFNRCWEAAHARAERGTAAAYDDVQRALVDLADAYTLYASRAKFEQRLPQFMAKHSKRGALVRRLVESGLWKNKS